MTRHLLRGKPLGYEPEDFLLSSRQSPDGGRSGKEFRSESSGEFRDRRALGNSDAPLVSFVLPQDHDPHPPTTQPLRRLIGAGKVAVDRNGVGPIGVPDQVDCGRCHGDRCDPR